MAKKGKPGGPDVKLSTPPSSPMGGANSGPGNLSNYKTSAVSTPGGGGTPGGRDVASKGQRKGKATNYQGSALGVKGSAGGPGGRNV